MLLKGRLLNCLLGTMNNGVHVEGGRFLFIFDVHLLAHAGFAPNTVDLHVQGHLAHKNMPLPRTLQ